MPTEEQAELHCVLFQGIDSNAVDVGRAEKDVTENNASMEDITMCAGDGGDAVTHANTQKYCSFFDFFLLFLFFLIMLWCEYDRAMNFITHSYFCPLHTY